MRATDPATPSVRYCCERKAQQLIAARWRVVRKHVPEALHASGDRSAASSRGWDGTRRFVTLDTSALPHVANARAVLGLRPLAPRAPPPPPGVAHLDDESWKDLFKQTVRPGAPDPIVQDTAIATLMPTSSARPGAVTKAPRRPPRIRQPPGRFRENS